MSRLHKTLLINFCFVHVFWNVEAVTFNLEAETTKVTFQKNQRSAASGGYTVLLHQGNEVEFKFCLVKSSNVAIENIYTSNDGDADTMEVKVDETTLKTFQSVGGSNNGQNWNIISSSGQIGRLLLNAGTHAVKIKVATSDKYGVELDVKKLNVEDDEITNKTFTCNLQCMTDAPNIRVFGREVGLKALQRSHPTNCSTESNVNIHIFHNTLKGYVLTASPPLYTTSSNNGYWDDKNCPAITPLDLVLSYQNVIVSPSTEKQTYGTSTISFSQQNCNTKIEMIANFTKANDANLGSELYLALKEPTIECNVSAKYLNIQGRLIMLPSKIFDSTETEHTWIIAESTWTDAGENSVFLIFDCTSEQTISNLRMVTQPIKYESFVVFQSDSIKVEANRPEGTCSSDQLGGMTLSLSSAQTWDNINYFSIATSIPDGFAQIFVLSHSGTVRLLYPKPSEFDWIPFGTSVILGQANVDDELPKAAISAVKINTTDLSMEVTYSDDSKTSLMLMTKSNNTELHVYGIDFKKDTERYPFATFLSKYVEIGISEADSIITDGSSVESVLGSWESLEGRTIFLYRTCESLYHTQSPDIMLGLTGGYYPK